jgi:hypothetical protein
LGSVFVIGRRLFSSLLPGSVAFVALFLEALALLFDFSEFEDSVEESSESEFANEYSESLLSSVSLRSSRSSSLVTFLRP